MSRAGMIISGILIIGLGSLFFFFQNQSPTNTKDESLALQYSGQTDSNLTSDKLSPQQNTPTPSISEVLGDETSVASTAAIVTSKGTIKLTLYPEVAPKTVANFVKKAKSDFYKDLLFHRVEDWVVQGGDPLGNGTGGGNMPVEFNNKPFVVGSLGVASRGDNVNQNDAQFFITKKDASWLNGKYTNFGIVTEGMDVVNQMEIGDKIVEITVE